MSPSEIIRTSVAGYLLDGRWHECTSVRVKTYADRPADFGYIDSLCRGRDAEFKSSVLAPAVNLLVSDELLNRWEPAQAFRFKEIDEQVYRLEMDRLSAFDEAVLKDGPALYLRVGPTGMKDISGNGHGVTEVIEG